MSDSGDALRKLDDLRKALRLPNRVRDLEGWQKVADDLIERCGADIVMLEERADKLAERLVRLEIAMGIAFVDSEREA